MPVCHVCSRNNADWVTYCTSCGAAIADRELAEPAECGHITYLLAQVAEWRARGLVPPGSAARIQKEYCARRAALAAGGRTATPTADAAAGPAKREVPDSVPESMASRASASVARPDAPGLAEFLEAHWLKLLAVLAAAFIFAGARQVLGWDWVNRAAQLVTPVVPIWLSVALTRYGARARERGEIGSRAYCSVGVVLAMFAVGSVNKQWLDGAMPSAWAYALGFLVSASAAVWVRTRTDDPAYGHFVVACSALALYAAAIGIAPLESIGDVWRPSGALLLVGLPCLWVAASRRRQANPQFSDDDTSILALWSHLLIAAAVVQVSVPVAWHMIDPTLTPTFSPVLAAAIVAIAGASYVVAGLAQGSASLSYYSVGLLALAGVDALAGAQNTGWLHWGVLFAALSLLCAAPLIGSQTEQQVSPESRLAFGRCALAGLAGTSLAVLGHHAEHAVLGQVVASPDWALGAALALFCVAGFAVASAVLARPEALYGAALFTVSATLQAWPITATARQYVWPWHGGHDLMPSALILLLAGALLATAWRRRSVGADDCWDQPLLVSATAVSGAGLVAAWTHSADPYGPGLWLAPGTHTIVAGLCAALLWRSRPVGYPQACLAVGLAGLATIVGLAAWTRELSDGTLLMGGDALRVVRLGSTLLVVGVIYGGVSEWLERARQSSNAVDPSIAALPVRAIGFATTLCGWPLLVGMLTFSAPSPSAIATACCAVAGAAFGLLVAVGRRRHPLLGVQAAVLTATAWAGALVGARGADASAMLAIAAAAGVALTFARAACANVHDDAEGYAWASASLLIMAWYGVVACWVHAPQVWHAACLAPALGALYLAGSLGYARDQELGRSFRRLSVVVGAVTAACTAVLALVVSDVDGRVTALTLLIYGVLFGVGAWRRATMEWSLASTACLAAAYGCWLAGLNVPVSEWSAWFAAGLLLAPLAARAVGAIASRRATADGIYSVAAAAAMAPFCVSLSVVTVESYGPVCVAAMALSGTVWTSTYVFRRVEALMHAGLFGYLAAYCVLLYDRVAISQGVLDLYLIPVGAYLLLLGHMADERGRSSDAAGHWWLGLLVVLSPTFLAFYDNFVKGGTALHAVLLLAQCMLAVGWGITRRIRAFVLCGAMFSLAFTAVLGAAAAKQIWVGLLALGLGMGLLVGVFMLSTRSAEARAWVDRAVQGWKRWR